MDRQIKEARRAATAAISLEDKLSGQQRVKDLEAKRKNQRRALFDAEDEIDQKRDDLIAQIQNQLKESNEQHTLFTIRWRLV